MDSRKKFFLRKAGVTVEKQTNKYEKIWKPIINSYSCNCEVKVIILVCVHNKKTVWFAFGLPVGKEDASSFASWAKWMVCRYDFYQPKSEMVINVFLKVRSEVFWPF